MMPTSFLNRLVGSWSVERKIVHNSGGEFSFSGTAEFSWISGCEVKYKETGLLNDGGGDSISASRVNVYKVLPSGELQVFLEDGSEFFNFMPQCGESFDVEHHCGDDVYLGSHVFMDQEIVMNWSVRGPSKSYDSHSILTRN